MLIESESSPPDADELQRLSSLLDAGLYAQLDERAAALLARAPGCGVVWKLLGMARLMSGRDALAVLHQATVLLPDDHQAHYNFALALQQAGQFEHALASCERVLAICPGAPDALEALAKRAELLVALGRYADAADGYRQLLTVAPDLAAAHLNLGNTLKLLGQVDDAMRGYQQALAIDPDYAQAHYNLGIVLHERSRHAEAVDCFGRALAAAPDFAPAQLNLGNAQKALGQFANAAASYRAALALRPDFAAAHLDLGNVEKALGRPDQALRCFRRALEIDPGLAAAHLNLGNTHKDLGHPDEALESYRRAIAIDADFYAAHDNLLFTQNLIVGHDPQAMLADARRFGERVAHRAARGRDWPNTPSPQRRLRVGLVSGDFRHHPVSYFLESVLGALKAGGRLDLFAYSNGVQVDALTERIRGNCHAWRAITGAGDARVDRQIRDDAIDILIDLSGHTEHNRLPLFAWKPAPVQVSWLGYHATSGVAAIDYIVADRWTVPAAEEAHFTEALWRLPETLWCLTPPEGGPDVSALPALANGVITFAAFCRLDKMNASVVALWARVLRAVPGSRLLMKAREFSFEPARRRVGERFARHGLGADRLILEGPSSRAEYLAAYRRVDIALDPFPYAGATTSVEGLWMGVPLITLAGQRFMSRQGVSLLMNAGLPEWIAADEHDYVARAVRHAGDLPALAALRATLRRRVQGSPLVDAPRFALNFEAALRGMWQAWCRRQDEGA